MKLPAELRFMIMEALSRPIKSDAYGNSLGTTRSKDGLLSTENLSWAFHWVRLRGVCRLLKLEADAHIRPWVQCHNVSVHAWDLTGSSDIPSLLFAEVTRLTVFFDLNDMLEADKFISFPEPNRALLMDFFKAVHFIAIMSRLKSLTIRWRCDSKDTITEEMLDHIQYNVFDDLFCVLYNCSPTKMACLESVTFIGWDPDVLTRDELCDNNRRLGEMVGRAVEQLRILPIFFVGRATVEYVV